MMSHDLFSDADRNNMKKIVRVLHLIPSTSGGGAEPIALRIAEHQSSHFDVYLAAWDSELKDSQSERGIEFVQIRRTLKGPLGGVLLVLRIRKLILKLQPDCIISHLTYMNLLTHIATRSIRRKIPTILVHHSAALKWKTKWKRALIRTAYSRNSTIAVSTDVAKFLERELRVAGVTVISNPLLLAQTDPMQNRSVDGLCKLVAVGRLVAEKNYPFLLEVLIDLPKNFSLTILGAGDVAPLVAMARSLGVSNRVLFRGGIPIAEVLSTVAEFDIFVMSSDAEGEPVALLEAASIGLPVVGRDTPGLGSAVRKVGGFLPVDSNSTASFAEAVIAAASIGQNSIAIVQWVLLHRPATASHVYCELVDCLTQNG